MVWLDEPRPATDPHTLARCLDDLPDPDPDDSGRRWRCDRCGRLYLASDGGGWLTLRSLPQPPETP